MDDKSYGTILCKKKINSEFCRPFAFASFLYSKNVLTFEDPEFCYIFRQKKFYFTFFFLKVLVKLEYLIKLNWAKNNYGICFS